MAQPRKLHDRYFKQAKAEGYLARSAYKLKEISQRKRLIRRGDWVLDLGCAPGSWLQVASELVGDGGVVVGLDLQAAEPGLGANVRVIVGDVFKTEAGVLLALADGTGTKKGDTSGSAGGTSGVRAQSPPHLRPERRVENPLHFFDVVLSDMAPNTTGAGDHFRSVDLCRRVVELLPALLREGGNLAMKVFEGELYPELLAQVRRLFEDAKGFKPQASRDASREMYIVGHGYRGGEGGKDVH